LSIGECPSIGKNVASVLRTLILLSKKNKFSQPKYFTTYTKPYTLTQEKTQVNVKHFFFQSIESPALEKSPAKEYNFLLKK
jgi:hypothetical protein